jgi:hypothetical protein
MAILFLNKPCEDCGETYHLDHLGCPKADPPVVDPRSYPDTFAVQLWMEEIIEESDVTRVLHEENTMSDYLSPTGDLCIDAARSLTEAIKGKLAIVFDEMYQVDQMLLEAHERKVWQALGYSSWEA